MGDASKKVMRLHIGGVMRCCVATLTETTSGEVVPDGTRFECRYCHDALFAKDGVWYWRGCPEVAEYQEKGATT